MDGGEMEKEKLTGPWKRGGTKRKECVTLKLEVRKLSEN